MFEAKDAMYKIVEIEVEIGETAGSYIPYRHRKMNNFKVTIEQ